MAWQSDVEAKGGSAMQIVHAALLANLTLLGDQTAS
jgi:hypothetical protein